MNTLARKIIMQSKDGARSRRNYNGYDNRRDYNEREDMMYDRGYDRGYDQARRDYAQGMKGTGRYGVGGSMYYGRDRESGDMSLSHEDMKEWKHSIENEDGTHGEHFSMGQIEDAMHTMGISPRDYTVEDLCMTANMLYSDYCKTLKSKISRDEEPMYYVSLAKDFLEDKDSSVSGSEKLSAYYYCIVKEDD